MILKTFFIIVRWGPSFEKELYDSRINTTRALAEAISEADKPPNVFVSTSAVGE